jgi:hypothetical protein
VPPLLPPLLLALPTPHQRHQARQVHHAEQLSSSLPRLPSKRTATTINSFDRHLVDDGVDEHHRVSLVSYGDGLVPGASFSAPALIREVPEHLESSPLCPRHPKHAGGGAQWCPYHGRAKVRNMMLGL